MGLLYSSYIKSPKNVCFDGEDKDEQVLLVLRRHFITNFNWVVVSILLFNAPQIASFILRVNGVATWEFLPISYRTILFFFWYLFSFGYFFVSFLIWYFSVYIVSSKRVVDIDFQGFTNRRFSEALLTNIQDLTHTINGTMQVIFHFGNLFIQTAAEKQEIEFESIPDPASVQDFISDITRGVKIDGAPDIKEPK
ncbi:hypothetical protein HYV31_02885 [candidate division WWE3 bacterium]|nr:hypothetical protein [candidate division WWE3 bacterium]